MDMNPSDTRGYAKVKEAAKYSGVSERTFREWLKDDLRHIRLTSGTILIPYAWIDEYLMRFEVSRNEVDDIVDEVMQEL
jgi:excisionase family DNA binding protein